MQQDITHVALDDSKRTIVAGILRPGSQEPDLRSIPNESRHLRRLVARLQRAGQYSIRINDQYRICFEWRDGDAYQVEIADYH